MHILPDIPRASAESFQKGVYVQNTEQRECIQGRNLCADQRAKRYGMEGRQLCAAEHRTRYKKLCVQNKEQTYA